MILIPFCIQYLETAVEVDRQIYEHLGWETVANNDLVFDLSTNDVYKTLYGMWKLPSNLDVVEKINVSQGEEEITVEE